jgi:hypothetical protein
MGLFGKAKSNPEATFESAIDDAVRKARANGVGRATIRSILGCHVASINSILAAESERRKMGDPISSYNPNRPQ